MPHTANQNADQHIIDRVDFTGSHFYGVNYSERGGIASSGRLPAEWLETLSADQPVYVVYSYGTPIAWVTKIGAVKIPRVKYSQSTTRHQGIAARALTGDLRARTPLGASL